MKIASATAATQIAIRARRASSASSRARAASRFLIRPRLCVMLLSVPDHRTEERL